MAYIYTYLHEAVTMAGILLSCFYIFGKALNHSALKIHKLFSVLWCVLLSFLHSVRLPGITFFMACSIFIAASILFIRTLAKIKPDTVISAFLFSFGVSYILYFVASSAVFAAAMPLASGEHTVGAIINYNTPFYLVSFSLISALQLFLSYLVFRIRRFRKGFPFLLKGYAVIGILITSGVVLGFVSRMKMLGETDDISAVPLLFMGIIIIGAGIYIWVKRGIKSSYLHWAKDRNKELYEQKLAEKDHEIQRLTELYGTVRSANHNIVQRLAALERGYVALLGSDNAFALNIAEELGVSLEDVRRAARDYQKDVSRGKGKKSLPSTKVKMLDDLFGLFAERCESRGIDFDLIVNGSIPYMVENVIDQSKLETMIGDHLQDALIAVGASGNPFRSVLVILGLADGCYALTIFDSGIPFELETLEQLGTKCVTTHADTGGSGEGFMKTFETMREYGASLIINEKEPGSAGLSKSVTIRFDGKEQYIVESCRLVQNTPLPMTI